MDEKNVEAQIKLKQNWKIVAVTALITALFVGVGIGWASYSYVSSIQSVFDDEVDVARDTIYNLELANEILQNKLEAAKGDLDLEEKLGYEIVNERCDSTECFLANDSKYVGLARLQGYYKKERREAFPSIEEGGQAECDSFVVTGGSKYMIDNFVELVEAGNTVNSRNALGQPVINLDLGSIQAVEKERIVNSNENNHLSLVVFRPYVGDHGVGSCYNMVDIIKVE